MSQASPARPGLCGWPEYTQLQIGFAGFVAVILIGRRARIVHLASVALGPVGFLTLPVETTRQAPVSSAVQSGVTSPVQYSPLHATVPPSYVLVRGGNRSSSSPYVMRPLS